MPEETHVGVPEDPCHLPYSTETNAALEGLAELVEEVKFLRQEVAGAATALYRIAEALERQASHIHAMADALAMQGR